MRPSMEARVSVCYGPIRSRQEILTSHGATSPATSFQRRRTSRRSLCLRSGRMKSRDRPNFCRTRTRSRDSSSDTSRGKGAPVSKRSRETHMTDGSPRPIQSGVRTLSANTLRITYGFRFIQDGSRKSVSMKSVASSKVQNLFFLHQ